jgi:hypothetical protein
LVLGFLLQVGRKEYSELAWRLAARVGPEDYSPLLADLASIENLIRQTDYRLRLAEQVFRNALPLAEG